MAPRAGNGHAGPDPGAIASRSQCQEPAQGRDLAACLLPETPGGSPRERPVWLWFATIGGLAAIILADLLIAQGPGKVVT
jgi:hypothetical protein